MPQPERRINDALTDVKHFFDPLVYGVRTGVNYVSQYGVQYASVVGLSIYNFYNFARPGQPQQPQPQPSYGWRDGWAPEEIEEGLHLPQGRTRSEPIPYLRISSSQTLAQVHTREQQPAASPIDQTDQHKIIRRQEKLSAAYQKTLRQRLQATQRRDDLHANLRSFEASLDVLMRSSQEQSATGAQSEDRETLVAQMRESGARLQTDIPLVCQDDDDLFVLEDELLKRGHEFVEATAALIQDGNIRPGVGRGDVSPTSTSRRSPSPTPSLITRYLDKRGDVIMLEERLQNFDTSHAEELRQRDFFRDQDQALDVTDLEFQQVYEDERAEIENDLHLAEEELISLEAQAKRRGLDTTFAARRSSDSDDRARTLMDGDFVIVPKEPTTTATDLGNWIQQIPTQDDDLVEDPNSIPPRLATPGSWPPSWTL